MAASAKKPVTAKTIKAQVIRDMKQLGTYRKEYDPVITIYAGMREQYQRLQEEAEEITAAGGQWYTTPTPGGGEKKSSLAAALESVRRDILTYSDRLMLNPKSRADALGKKEARPVSKLEEVLRSV